MQGARPSTLDRLRSNGNAEIWDVIVIFLFWLRRWGQFLGGAGQPFKLCPEIKDTKTVLFQLPVTKSGCLCDSSGPVGSMQSRCFNPDPVGAKGDDVWMIVLDLQVFTWRKVLL